MKGTPNVEHSIHPSLDVLLRSSWWLFPCVFLRLVDTVLASSCKCFRCVMCLRKGPMWKSQWYLTGCTAERSCLFGGYVSCYHRILVYKFCFGHGSCGSTVWFHADFVNASRLGIGERWVSWWPRNVALPSAREWVPAQTACIYCAVLPMWISGHCFLYLWRCWMRPDGEKYKK